jgi:hypothetical protein
MVAETNEGGDGMKAEMTESQRKGILNFHKKALAAYLQFPESKHAQMNAEIAKRKIKAMEKGE